MLELGGGGVLVWVDAVLVAEGGPGLDSVVGQAVGLGWGDVEEFGDGGRARTPGGGRRDQRQAAGVEAITQAATARR